MNTLLRVLRLHRALLRRDRWTRAELAAHQGRALARLRAHARDVYLTPDGGGFLRRLPGFVHRCHLQR